MRNINEYIIEKLIIDKDVKSMTKKKEEINDSFTSAIRNYCRKEHNINFSWENSVDVIGKNKDMVLITLDKNHHYLYKSIIAFINEHYPIRKNCSTNNQ